MSLEGPDQKPEAEALVPEPPWVKKPWLIRPGEKRNPTGKKNGTRNKLGKKFIEVLHDDFLKHGKKAIEKCRNQKPDAYLRIVASMLPKQVKVSVDPLDTMSDDELLDNIDRLTRLANQLLAPPASQRGRKTIDAEEVVVVQAVSEAEDLPRSGEESQ